MKINNMSIGFIDKPIGKESKYSVTKYSDAKHIYIYKLYKYVKELGFKTVKNPIDTIGGYCASNNNSFSYSFNYNGDIYKCPCFIGIEEFCIGYNLNLDKQNKENIEINSSLEWSKKRECINCEFLPICNGGCRFKALVNTNNYNGVTCDYKYYSTTGKKLIEMLFLEKIKELNV